LFPEIVLKVSIIASDKGDPLCGKSLLYACDSDVDYDCDSVGAFSTGAFSTGAFSNGAFSTGAFSTGDFSTGAC